MKKYLLEFFINVIIPYGILIVCFIFKVEDSIASLLLNLLPLLILSITYYYNRPIIYMKILTTMKARTNVKFRFQYYSLLDFRGDMDFRKFVEEYIEKFKEVNDDNIKITESKYGRLQSKVKFDADCIQYELDYNQETQELNFLINSKITFRLFIKEITRAARPFDEIARKSHDVIYNENINSLRIEFLKTYDNTDIKNPLFQKLYDDFTVINAILKYKTKRNTIVELNNNSISFNNKINIFDFVNDVKKQMRLIG